MNIFRDAMIVMLLWACSAHAGLTWETTTQEIHAKPLDTEAVAIYRFTNKSDRTVRIHDVKTSCGCTAATPDKKIYEPGESGEIRAVFRFGGRQGVQAKTITVETSDDRQAGSEPLKLLVKIPTLVQFATSYVIFKPEELGQPKTVRVHIAHTEPIHVIEVRASGSDPAVTASVQALKAGTDYTITVSASREAKPGLSLISIATDYPADAPRTFTIYARVNEAETP